MTTVYNALHGIGDNLMISALLRGHTMESDAWIVTDFPWMYRGIKAKLRASGSQLAANRESRAKHAGKFSSEPVAHIPTLSIPRDQRIFYYDKSPEMGMVGAAAATAKIPNTPNWTAYHLQEQGKAWGRIAIADGWKVDRPIAVVRPVTHRAEYPASARACLPSYVNKAAAALMDTHYVVSIANTNDREHLVGDPPPAHKHMIRGEVPIEAAIAITCYAQAVVAPIGWAIIAAAMGNVPTLRIFGQAGRWNSPLFFRDIGGNNTDAIPDAFDYNGQMAEVSDNTKTISNFDTCLTAFLQRVATSPCGNQS